MPNFCKGRRFLKVDVAVCLAFGVPLQLGNIAHYSVLFSLFFSFWFFPCSLRNISMNNAMCLALLLVKRF